MPSCSTAKNPRGITITFTEDDHKYRSVINGKEVLYTSGTQFLGKFYPVFDPTGTIAERCARKEGISVAAIKAKWAAKGQESCRLGTRLHETIEDTLLRRDKYRNVAEDSAEMSRFEKGIAIGKKLLQKTDILGVEKIVFSDKLLIAGTIDLLAQSKKDGTYLIIDHKTNKSIDQENKYKKFCLDPIAHIPDLNYWHYGLQLNLYEYLLKREGYVDRDAKFRLFLNHVTAESAKLIELPDLQSEIRDLVIEHLLSKIDVLSFEKSPSNAQNTNSINESPESILDSL